MYSPNIPLKPVPSAAWLEEYEQMSSDPWLFRKLSREKRLADKLDYIDKRIPELVRFKGGLVIDLGPGPGEFLEVCRHLGFDVLGVDAETGEGGMGNEYLAMSRLLCERQDVPVEYVGLRSWVEEPFDEGPAVLINSQGSIEQMFSHRMEGPPHHLHQDCSRLSWIKDKQTEAEIQEFVNACFERLEPSGLLVIYANGSKNHAWFDERLRLAAVHAGFDLLREGSRFCKWRKPIALRG